MKTEHKHNFEMGESKKVETCRCGKFRWTEKQLKENPPITAIEDVQTWLPGFSGFYGSIWEENSGDENELEYINDRRKEKGLSPISFDDCEFDYKSWYQELSEKITRCVGNYLQKAGFIAGFKFEELRSPREYNFANDAIDVRFRLTEDNRQKITDYLIAHKDAFAKYLTRYTMRSGFIPSYSDDVNIWLADDYLHHAHKLGAVLDFILAEYLRDEDGEKDVDLWLYEATHEISVVAKNYSELIGEVSK